MLKSVCIKFIRTLFIALLLLPFSASPVSALTNYTERELRSLGIEFVTNDKEGLTCSPTTTPTSAVESGSGIYMLGDSITVGAQADLTEGIGTAGFSLIKINAVVSRSLTDPGEGTTDAAEAIAADEKEVKLADVIVIALGTNSSDSGNGEGFKSQGEALIKQITGDDGTPGLNPTAKIFWVNIFSDGASEYRDAYNAVIAGFSSLGVTAIDTTGAGISVGSDHLHPDIPGRKRFAETVIAALGGKVNGAGPTSPQSGSCNGSPLPGNNNAEKIWNFLLEKGLTPVQIAGFMGNLQAEGGFEPRRVQYGTVNADGVNSVAGQPSSLHDDIVVNGQSGYGIAQWTSSGRQQALKTYAESKGTIAGDLTTQLEFLWQEITTGYQSSVLTPLQAATTVRGAADIVLMNFECPRACVNVKENSTALNQAAIAKVLDVRAAFGDALLAQYGSNTNTSGGDN